MRLSGIELHNFRSIGEEGVLLRPWEATNILVGQNNSGKSNALRALALIQSVCRADGNASLTDLDLHSGNKEAVFRFRVYFHVEESDGEQARNLAQILGKDEIYFEITLRPPSTIGFETWSGADVTDYGRSNKVMTLVRNKSWTRMVSEEEITREMRECAEPAFNWFKGAFPRVHNIPEFRQVRTGDKYTFDGQNLIGLLGEYQNPEVGEGTQRDRFDLIESFLLDLLHLPHASLDVTRKEQRLVIKNQALRLPLESFGTGTHELVIMLTAVLSKEGDLFCIEEPEIHMHPRLQRELLRFITKETANSYLITSHSPVFVDAVQWLEDVQVFHLETRSGATAGRPVLDDMGALHALHDLGISPSDVLQANCTIWVEGPSDVVYIRRWIELVAPTLAEGRDFSIMFYGGVLLSHVSLARNKVPEELIQILRINQRAIVVIDSDRKRPRGGRLTQTKERVQRECEDNGGYCWITDGREIENLLPLSVVNKVFSKVARKKVKMSIGKYENFQECLSKALSAAGTNAIDYNNNKVKYARLISQSTELDDLGSELRTVLGEVVAKITTWNNL